MIIPVNEGLKHGSNNAAKGLSSGNGKEQFKRNQENTQPQKWVKKMYTKYVDLKKIKFNMC